MKVLLCCLLSILALALLSACGKEGNRPQAGVVQTGFPGEVSAGGGTSGTVMAQSSAAKSGSSMPAGTPGTPKGAEGNVGGAEIGGAQSGAAAASAQGNQGGAPSAPAAGSGAASAPPVREGRGTTAPDAASAGSIAHGKVANSPPAAAQARKEHAK